ncbi:YfiT family bacillithiol transferase [Cohnella abietis]|uniref:Putative metal-dependent hydrolase YfiT n=1 Tax=Cohnella abietis TaxID=2507935 RepID=A0A3T1DCH4_9BACL|nr:putative metal-dependent hydrolase YfiT [Cohnella abietis]
MDEIRFPIGQFEPNLNPTDEDRSYVISQIPNITLTLKSLVENLTPDQLQIPYRPNGWTIQQIVHHLADNDMNAYLRFKRALTEFEPLGNSYREDLWAELIDYKEIPVEESILLLEVLHRRLLILLNGLAPDEFNRGLRTQVLGTITLDTALQRFVWHNQHHISQIKSLMDSEGWL